MSFFQPHGGIKRKKGLAERKEGLAGKSRGEEMGGKGGRHKEGG